MDQTNKYDGGKPRWDLLPLGQVAKIVNVLTFGLKKYSEESWKKVDQAEKRYYAALMRHMDAWRNGEKIDSESGLSHLAHASCCLIFLMWFADNPQKEELEMKKIKTKDVKIVCICGSTKFCKEISVYKWELEKQGIMAIGLHLLPANYFNVQPSHQAEFEGVAGILDELHFRKIEMADEIFIFNKDGYIGNQTRIEIDYSESLGKKIVYKEEIKP